MADTSPIQIGSPPGVQRDGTRFDTSAHNDAQWCRWAKKKPRKMGGYRSITDYVPEISRGLHGFYSNSFSYLHSGGSNFIGQATANSGIGSGYNDRTPATFIASPNNSWTFDVRYDPFKNNQPMIVGHAGQNLTNIDNSVETPVFWGPATASSALTPMSIPPRNLGFSVGSFTGTTTSASPTVTAIASTAGLAFGMIVIGTGIPANTYITALTGTTLTLSQNATASGTVTIVAQVGGCTGGIVALHPYLMHYGSDGRVGWSTNANPNDFWGTGSGEAFVTSQKIVKGLSLRGGPGNSPSGLLWSLTSLIRVSFNGGATTFAFDEISTSISVLSPRSIVEFDGIYFWPGVDRFFMFNGTVRELPNDYNIDWFFKNINPNQKQKAFAFKNTRWGEVWFCAPMFGATECSHAVIYNIRDNCWYDTKLPGNGRSAAIAPVVYPYPYMAGVDQDSGTSVYTLWQHEDGVDEVKGGRSLAVQSYYETGDITLLTQQQASDKAIHVAVFEPDFVQTGDVMMTVVGNANARADDVTSNTRLIVSAPTKDQQIIEWKETRRQMRFRFESNVAGGYFEAGKMFAHIKPDAGKLTG